MLRVFHLDVAKIDRNVAHVVVAIHVYVPNFSFRFPDVCLQVFRLDVAYVFLRYEVFSGVFCKCLVCMFRVFQLFHTYVASVSSGCFKK
jgi:hypothetical protein